MVLISIGSLLGTLLFVKVLKNYANEPHDDNGAFLAEALKGKKAVSVLIKSESLPMEFLYPGVKVDLVDKKTQDITYVVKDVYVVGVSIVQEGAMTKVTLAVNNDEGERVIKTKSDDLGLIIRGYGSNKDNDDVEIVEL